MKFHGKSPRYLLLERLGFGLQYEPIRHKAEAARKKAFSKLAAWKVKHGFSGVKNSTILKHLEMEA